jgi:hypothetical protein
MAREHERIAEMIGTRPVKATGRTDARASRGARSSSFSDEILRAPIPRQ